MKLSDTTIRNAKPKEKPYKLPREDGLYLQVNPNGSKWWRFSYRFAGKEKLLSFGTYPEVPLVLARQRRDTARQLVAAGKDCRIASPQLLLNSVVASPDLLLAKPV